MRPASTFSIIQLSNSRVRGIKLSLDDRIEEVYMLNKDIETTIIYNEKPVSLNRLKLGHRDTKGIKIRV